MAFQTLSIPVDQRRARRLPRLAALLVLAFGWSIAVLSGLGGGRPVEAAAAEQYASGGIPVDPCFAPIADATATCAWVFSQLPGGRLGGTIDQLTPGMIGALQHGGRTLVVEADELVASQRDGAWWYPTPLALRSRLIQAPWKSASTQGLALSVLARAQVVAPDSRYLDAIRAAVSAMPIGQDGWPDEYGDGSHVLSAGMTAALGLFDASRIAGSSEARVAFQRAVAWLQRSIDSFDSDFEVLYATGPLRAPADLAYLHESIAQLEVLSQATGSSQLNAKAAEWSWRISEPGAFRLQLMLATPWYQPFASIVAFGSTVAAVFLAWPPVGTRRRHAREIPSKSQAN